jgi:hypothetical protein
MASYVMDVDEQPIVKRRRGWPRPKPNPNELPLERVLGLTGEVTALHLHVAHRMPMVPVTSVEGRRNGGLQGDSHVLRRNRAVTIVDRSTLDALGLRPGDLREQITVSGLPEITNLPRGTRVRAGGLVLRINGPCEPCTHIGKMLGVEDPEALRKELLGRRGATCTVVAVDGPLTVGDTMAVEQRQPLAVRRKAARSAEQRSAAAS